MARPFHASGPLLAVWAALGTGIAWREGEFSVVAIVLVLAAWAGLAAVVVRGGVLTAPSAKAVGAAACLALAAAVILPPDRNMHAGGRVVVIQLLFVLQAAAAVVVTLVARLRGRSWVAPALLLLAAATGAGTLAIVRDPQIDVWQLLQQSSDGLVHGQNMYEQRWTGSTGLQDVYPYLPGTSLLLAPFRLAFDDVRVGLLVAELATVLVAWRLGRRRSAPAVVALLLVLQPKWPWLVDQGWTEPLLVLCLAAALLALDSDHPAVAMVLVALALASKQHVVLLVPLLACWPQFGWRRALGSLGLAGAVVVPWLVWSPQAFWDDAVAANLSLPVIERALSLPALLLRWGVDVGGALTVGGLLLAYALVWRCVPRTVSGLALGSAFVLLTLDVTNKQSFYNHYTLVLGLLVLAVVTAQPPESASSAPAGITRSSGSSSQPSGNATRF